MKLNLMKPLPLPLQPRFNLAVPPSPIFCFLCSLLATKESSFEDLYSSFEVFWQPAKQENMEGVLNSATGQELIPHYLPPGGKSTLENCQVLQYTSIMTEANVEQKKKKVLEIEGYPIEGLSIGGHETCVIFPSLKLAFDIGKCPQRAISQDFLFISHGHMDHIGGLPMYVATRGLYKMKPPTIIVPMDIKENVEKLLEVHRAMDQSELKNNLIGLRVGEELDLRRDLKVRAFRTYHVIPSQGYIIYSVKQKLKPEYIGLPGNEIKELKLAGVEITDTVTTPEVAFTGDTMSDFILDPDNSDVLRAKILVVESTFVDDAMTVENARDYGHTHLFEIVGHADKFHNKAILLIHFSARYTQEEIQAAVSALPPSLAGRVFALTEGI